MRALNYYLLLIIFIFLTACNSTKEIKKEESNSSVENNLYLNNTLNNKLSSYFNALENFNNDVVIEMTYARLFSVISPDLFRQYMDSMINSKDVKMISYRTNTPKIFPIRRFSNGTEFAQIDYNSTVTLKFINPNLYGSQEQMNYLYDVSIDKFGVENVSIDLNSRTLSVTKPEKLLAIKEQDMQWKFIGDDARYRKYFPNFMPPEILQNLE